MCVILIIIMLPVINNIAVYSQSDTHIQQQRWMNSTSRGSLEVKLEAIPYPIESNKDMEFKVSFLKPNSSILQDNVDFNFIILKDGKRVFQASNHTDRPSVLLHTTNGSMTIPILNYKFNEEGPYLVQVPIYAILYNPIRPEYANFTIGMQSMIID
ncbi:MAG TPA: hypothetical protein VFH25_06350 [Nitrososphaeraceae archaeon]|nr:hypothetical protein [Nitrososphaeraceae archaeon]